jgi:DNA-binding beta-propeller fold protein YncE
METIMKRTSITAGLFGILALTAAAAKAEQTALVLFETKGAQALRQEGMAFVEIDPEAPDYGKILARIDLPPDMIGHHIFYNSERDRAYVTALGRSELWVFDVTKFPYRPNVVPVPDCVVGEDVTFSEALGRWYLSCMGSSVVIVGDAETDEPLRTIELPEPWPHGITVHDGIDRILLTSTSNPADFSQAGETITVLRASTEEVLSTHKVSNKPSPSNAEPVEIFFVPGTEPPLAYITNVTEGTLWMAEWQPEAEEFAFRQAFDFGTLEQGMPLEVYFDAASEHAYITTALPGHLNAFDISDPQSPVHLWAAEAAPGAHHLVFSPDGRRAYVQNGLANIDGVNDGSISVIDLETGTKSDSIDTFKDAGFTVNMIALTPEAADTHTH